MEQRCDRINMKRHRQILVGVFFLQGCSFATSDCCNYEGTHTVSDSLYVGRYTAFCAGVFGERTDYYLTDSSRFRKKIGWSDEHSGLSVIKNGAVVDVYRIESNVIVDTISSKTIALSDILSSHHFDSSGVNATPVFGKNIKLCNSWQNLYCYKNDDGFYIAEDQFHCGNDYVNALYFTDSVHFRILLGFQKPGEARFDACKNSKGEIVFIEFNRRNEDDTIEHKVFKMCDLIVGGMEKTCKDK